MAGRLGLFQRCGQTFLPRSVDGTGARNQKGNVLRRDAHHPGGGLEIAQEWLDVNLLGQEADRHADAFYGYYTLHTLRDGRITGMLNVHGTTGQV